MSLRRTLLLAALIWFIWVLAWLFLTYYVTGGSPRTLGRTVFAFFGPIVGFPAALVGAFGYRELLDQERSTRK